MLFWVRLALILALISVIDSEQVVGKLVPCLGPIELLQNLCSTMEVHCQNSMSFGDVAPGTPNRRPGPVDAVFFVKPCHILCCVILPFCLYSMLCSSSNLSESHEDPCWSSLLDIYASYCNLSAARKADELSNSHSPYPFDCSHAIQS